MDVVLLLDRSGSAVPLTERHIELVHELEARAGERLAVYGYTTASQEGAELTPLKAAGGPFDEAALRGIAPGGTPTGDAIAKVAKLHGPSRLLVVTDSYSYKPETVPEAIAALPEGWEVYGLHDDVRPLDAVGRGEMDKQFGDHWAPLDEGDPFTGLDKALTAPTQPQLSTLDEAGPTAESPARAGGPTIDAP